jgi:hypothetical protein
VHTAKLDALEDRLVAREVGAANDAADGHAAWQEARHRCAARASGVCGASTAAVRRAQRCRGWCWVRGARAAGAVVISSTATACRALCTALHKLARAQGPHA